jgi:hypothetical protein
LSKKQWGPETLEKTWTQTLGKTFASFVTFLAAPEAAISRVAKNWYQGLIPDPALNNFLPKKIQNKKVLRERDGAWIRLRALRFWGPGPISLRHEGGGVGSIAYVLTPPLISGEFGIVTPDVTPRPKTTKVPSDHNKVSHYNR